MRGPYLFPVLRGQAVKALRICDPTPDDSLNLKQPGHAHFGAVALECERHALLCYCPVRYLLYPHGSTFRRFGGMQVVLPFRASLCEVGDLEDWLPITAGAHWSHYFDLELPMRGDVLAEAPQLVRSEEVTDWQLELRFSTSRRFRLSGSGENNRLRLGSAEVGAAVV